MKPLFMWAGGKSKMIKNYAPFFKNFDVYLEPFFGGGAMLLQAVKINPNAHFVVNDINQNIIDIYQSIKNDTEIFLSRLDKIESNYINLDKVDRKNFYYDLRNEYAYDYEKWNKTEESAVLYFLMKTGFNGIWQINKNTNNRFGTPCGLLNEKDSVYDRENVKKWSELLQKVKITSSDYKSVYEDVRENSWVFMDPPYRGSYTKYATSFEDSNQKEVIDFSHEISKKKSTCWVSNRDLEDSFFENYLLEKNYKMSIHKFDVTYTAGRRKKSEEGFEAKKAKEVLIIS